jgi:exodeoxyribonuclease VII large subunit
MQSSTSPKAASVSELVLHIKHTLEETFHEVMVEGEISGISVAHSGHCYFNLMDDEASISCALFRQDLLRHPGFKNIKDGDRVLVYGPVTVYQKRGSFQIIAKRVMPAGEGLWKLRLEQLKKKLQAEGLFEPDRKRKLPAFPRRIALITAPGGAALHDFINVYRRRALQYEIVLVPALVQGDKAPASLCAALDRVSRLDNFDVVVITRGGGSPEDLWCFNDENLVRKMASLSMPVISAVGHEVDWTLSDYVADVRSETPTAAAEMLTQPQTIVRRRLSEASKKLSLYLRNEQMELKNLLTRFHPRQLIGIVLSRLQEQKERLAQLNPLPRIHQFVPVMERNQAVDELFQRLMGQMKSIEQSYVLRIQKAEAQLFALDPRAVLKRGYSMAVGPNGVISTSKDWKQLKQDSVVTIAFHDGEGKAKKVEE